MQAVIKTFENSMFRNTLYKHKYKIYAGKIIAFMFSFKIMYLLHFVFYLLDTYLFFIVHTKEHSVYQHYFTALFNITYHEFNVMFGPNLDQYAFIAGFYRAIKIEEQERDILEFRQKKKMATRLANSFFENGFYMAFDDGFNSIT